MSKSAARAVWGASPAGTAFAGGAAPGTREFFETVLAKRSAYEQPWLPEVVPFDEVRGRRVLELGCGAGFDAFEFCRRGADYTGVDLTPENILRTRRHLSFYGYEPPVEEGDAEALRFADASFDIVFSNGVLHHTPDMARSFREASRVLVPGGEFWVILYHKTSLYYWVTLGLVNHVLRLGFLRRSFREGLARIEQTTSSELPLVNVYTRGELATRLRAAGFEVEAVHVRKLVKEDLPPVPLLDRCWSLIPQRALDAVGRRFGWYVIARARKSTPGARGS